MVKSRGSTGSQKSQHQQHYVWCNFSNFSNWYTWKTTCCYHWFEIDQLFDEEGKRAIQSLIFLSWKKQVNQKERRICWWSKAEGAYDKGWLYISISLIHVHFSNFSNWETWEKMSLSLIHWDHSLKQKMMKTSQCCWESTE